MRREALRLVRERYADFGPTFAAEKLSEDHGLWVSRETLRKWMSEEGLWRPKRRREARVHQSRPRRALIVFVDDATADSSSPRRLLALGFFGSETTEAYMETLRGHLAAHGRPAAPCSDRYGVFRVNRKGSEDAPTQFTRALGTLDIEPIHASTPQAKGAWSGRTGRCRIGS